MSLSDLSLPCQGDEKRRQIGEPQYASSLFKKSSWILTLQFNQEVISYSFKSCILFKIHKGRSISPWSKGALCPRTACDLGNVNSNGNIQKWPQCFPSDLCSTFLDIDRKHPEKVFLPLLILLLQIYKYGEKVVHNLSYIYSTNTNFLWLCDLKKMETNTYKT